MTNFYEYRLVREMDEVRPVETSRPALVACLNTHSFVLALDDEDFHSSLLKCDYLLPDGEGVVYAMYKRYGEKIHKIAGDDIHRYLLDGLSSKGGGRVYYMGSREETLRLIVERLSKEYPTIEVKCYSPSYCKVMSEEECNLIMEDIKQFSPDVLFVGLGAPKQEKWMVKHCMDMDGVGVVAAIGAVFDFYSGVRRRAPMWMVRMRMEWLYRLLREPRKIWNRVFVSTPRFMRWIKKHKVN